MNRFYAEQRQGETGWRIYDRENKNKYIAFLTASGRCDYHNKGYWGTNVQEWRDAVERAQKENS